jgi:lipoyl-dependent peroxiredoxin
MTRSERLLYTARTRTTGGRDGCSRSDDGRLEVKLSTPGMRGAGTNPEQLFAAAWSACFEGAIAIAARKLHVTIPAEPIIDTEVDLNIANGEYFLRARLNVSMPDLPQDTAWAVLDAAHQICPYSKAMRGNIDAAINLV